MIFEMCQFAANTILQKHCLEDSINENCFHLSIDRHEVVCVFWSVVKLFPLEHYETLPSK